MIIGRQHAALLADRAQAEPCLRLVGGSWPHFRSLEIRIKLLAACYASMWASASASVAEQAFWAPKSRPKAGQKEAKSGRKCVEFSPEELATGLSSGGKGHTLSSLMRCTNCGSKTVSGRKWLQKVAPKVQTNNNNKQPSSTKGRAIIILSRWLPIEWP